MTTIDLSQLKPGEELLFANDGRRVLFRKDGSVVVMLGAAHRTDLPPSEVARVVRDLAIDEAIALLTSRLRDGGEKYCDCDRCKAREEDITALRAMKSTEHG